jgi:hypothetical protein
MEFSHLRLIYVEDQQQRSGQWGSTLTLNQFFSSKYWDKNPTKEV